MRDVPDTDQDLAGLAREFVQTLPNPVLVAAIQGALDLNRIARGELASRGLDTEARRVGFERPRALLLEATVAAIVERLCAAGSDAEALDELVHELFAAKAASVNNLGMRAQVDFLVQACGIAEAVALLNEHLGIAIENPAAA